MDRQDYTNRIVLVMAIGLVSILGAIVIGEMYISHSRGNEISSEIITLMKMVMTGMLSTVSGYIGYVGGKNAGMVNKNGEEEDDS